MRAPARLLGETDKAYAALLRYLEVGTGRTIGAVAAELSRSPGYRRVLEGWSSRWDWAARAQRYDSEAAAVVLTRAVEESADRLSGVRARLCSAAGRAVDVLEALLGEEASSQRGATVRLQAARAVLELAGVVPPKRGEVERPTSVNVNAACIVSRMSVEELEAIVAQYSTT